MFFKIIAFIALVTLSSCSSLKLSYQFADWILFYKLRDYVDLSGQQKERVEVEFDKLIQWHTQIELPKYIRILTNIKADIQNNTLQTKWDSYQQQYYVRQTVLLERIIPPLSEIILEMSPEQLKDLKENLQEENEELIEDKNLEVEERKEKRIERYIENYEYWLGSLSDEQMTKIKEFGLTLPLTIEHRLEGRIQGQTLFFELMNQRESGIAEIQDLLERLWIKKDFDWAQKIKLRREMIGNLNKKFLTEFSHSVSDQQKENLVKQLDSIVNDFKDIIQDHLLAAKE